MRFVIFKNKCITIQSMKKLQILSNDILIYEWEFWRYHKITTLFFTLIFVVLYVLF